MSQSVRLITIVLLITCSVQSGFAQLFSGQTNKLGNMGTEFYFTFVPCYQETGNNKLMLYICSVNNGFATVIVEGRGFSKTVKVKANDIVPVELSAGYGQVFSQPISGSIPPEQVYAGAAVHVKSTVPILVYGVTRFNYTSDSFLALPVEALGDEYVVASMPDMSWMYGGISFPSETAIVAAYDSTRVDFTLGGPSVTVSGGGMRPGQTKSFTMNKGDVWVIGNAANSLEGDMTGSYIKATKPVAVISGNQCANVPTVLRYCDFMCEMEMPTRTWGRQILIPKYAARINGYCMKVFAKEPNTKVFYNGSFWKTIQTVGGQEGAGWIYQRVDGSGNNVLSLSADKPISVTVFNPGQEDDQVSTDPYQMGVLPLEQFSTAFMFCSPGSRGGIGFTRNFVGIIFEIDGTTGGMPADLEFGVAVNGIIVWRPLSIVFGPTFNTKDIFQTTIQGKKYAFKECVIPSDNAYSLRCSKPFMSYSYGGSDYDSYGHPSGALAYEVQKLDDHVKPTLQYTQSGATVNGSTRDLPSDAAVRSNLGKIFLNYGSVNANLTSSPIVGPGIETATWTVVASDKSIEATAFVTVSDRAGNDTTVMFTIAPTAVNPEIAINGASQLCPGDSVVLSTGAGYTSYQWSSGETTPSITYHAVNVGTSSVSVTVKTAAGETLTSVPVQIVTNAPPPQPVITQMNDVLTVGDVPGCEYSWYKNGTLIIGEKSLTLKMLSIGNYRVRAHHLVTGCTSESHIFNVTSIADVESDKESENIRLTPNPTSSKVELHFGTLRPVKIELVSVRGVVLQSIDLVRSSGDKQEIDLTSMEAGTFFLKIYVNGKVVVRKVVKE